MEESAESILKSYQEVLLLTARAGGFAALIGSDKPLSDRDAMLEAERAYGAKGSQHGRLLSELLVDSFAWDFFAQRDKRGNYTSSIRGLCECEPLLKIMRDSGELAEREGLLSERDNGFVAVWQNPSLTNDQRQRETQAAYDTYFAGVRRISEQYRARYDERRNVVHGDVTPLIGPKIRSHPILQPPLMALMYNACHAPRDGNFQPFVAGGQAGLEFRQNQNSLQVFHPEAAPIDAHSHDADQDAFQAWLSVGTNTALDKLDSMAWDLAALSVSAFYARTTGGNPDASFALLIDDYFDWRGVDPRKRTPELRKQIDERIQLLCSDQVQLYSETTLRIADPETGKRKKTPVVTEGSFLVKKSRFFLGNRSPRDVHQRDVPDGYLLGLGTWAEKFVEERAMLGIFFKRLAEYDLGRQQWERRIGWYLVFQLNNQASKMKFQDTVVDGKARTIVTTQHSLRMKTVLENSHVAWQDMAKTNPGKVIGQWCEALETLKKDGLLSDFYCLDGAVDGADLPTRGRLTGMLERRYQFIPGKGLLKHLRSKKNRSEQHRERLLKRPREQAEE
jgi:hypothetical protein